MQYPEESYRPIKIDFSVPRECEQNTTRGKWCRFLMRVQSKLRLLLYCDRTYEKQIDAELKTRRKFPLSEWKECFSDVKVIRKILKDVTVNSGRINHHYIPSDSLLSLLYDARECDGHSVWLSFSLRDYAGIRCDVGDIARMANEECTLKDFFCKIGVK